MAQVLAGGFTIVYDWVWITDAYRKTEFELTVGGKRYKIYEPTGAFGYLAEHEGLVSGWEQSIAAGPADEARFEQVGTNTYCLRVPDGGKVQVLARLKAKEFKVPWWLWLLLVILVIIAWLGRKLLGK